MKCFLLVINGFEGIEGILGLFDNKEAALARRLEVQTRCATEGEKRKQFELLPEHKQEEAADRCAIDWDFAYTDPDAICVREITDDGADCQVECVSACTKYKFMG